MSKALEEWRTIQGYEGLYEVSDWGRIKSLERDVESIRNGKTHIRHYKEKIRKPKENDSGHLQVSLCKNGKYEYPQIHRLIAEAFIPNPNNYDVVHHVDGNPLNNSVENLIWIDGNEHRGIHIVEHSNKAKSVYQYTFDGELIKVWKSITECNKHGFNGSSISHCCKRINNKYKGYKWSHEPL